MRMFLIILGMILVGEGGGGIAKGGNGILPVQAGVEIKINNSVSSIANGEECVKSEVIEESGEGNISIKSQLECVSDGNDDGNENKEEDVGVRQAVPVQENISDVEVKLDSPKMKLNEMENLIIFDRESYRKYVLGMGDVSNFSELVRSLFEVWKNKFLE